MDNVFRTLVMRPTKKVELKMGNPWEIIPIKNKKSAKECTEIHLADQNIDNLTRFEDFPNIEVLWLNNNKIEKLENLESNFRIKHIYLQSNKIKTLEGSLNVMMHLETLSLYNNELRGLDDVIEFLKKYTHLKQLDLFGNPLAEEPYYRQKIIYYLPQLKVFDRHIIEFDDREKAKATIQKLNNPKKKNLKTKKTQNAKSLEKKNNKFQFSSCERSLFNEAQSIMRSKQEDLEKTETLERTRLNKKFSTDYGDYIPKATIVWEVPNQEQEDPVTYVTEWEKNNLKKIFKKYDKDKSASVSLENLPNLFEDLINDQALIGKSPNCKYEEFLKIFDLKEKETKIVWDTFRSFLNKVKWRKADPHLFEERIKNHYYEANKNIMLGKKQDSFNALFKAVHLESIKNLDEVEKKAFKIVEVQKEKNRFDYFDFDAMKHRTLSLENHNKQMIF